MESTFLENRKIINDDNGNDTILSTNNLPDNENIEYENIKNEFYKKEFRIGYSIDILTNNFVEFILKYIPLEEVTLNKIIDIEKETTISIQSNNPLLITKWNYINFGITKDNRLFIQVINDKFDINTAKINKSNPIILPGISIDYFLNSIIKNENTTIYDNNLKIYDADIDNLYFRFPPILIGGLENKNKSSDFFKTTDIDKIPNKLKKLKLQPGLGNGFKDFEISTFRYYNKELNQTEKEDEYTLYDIKNSNLEIKNNCFMDLEFDEIDDNRINDKSGNANHGYLFGDMKINIINDGKEFEIFEKDLPELKNNEGPF